MESVKRVALKLAVAICSRHDTNLSDVFNTRQYVKVPSSITAYLPENTQQVLASKQ